MFSSKPKDCNTSFTIKQHAHIMYKVQDQEQTWRLDCVAYRWYNSKRIRHKHHWTPQANSSSYEWLVVAGPPWLEMPNPHKPNLEEAEIWHLLFLWLLCASTTRCIMYPLLINSSNALIT